MKFALPIKIGGGQVEVKKCLLLGDSSLIHRPLPGIMGGLILLAFALQYLQR